MTLAMWTDTNAIAKAGLIAKDWATRLPERLAALHVDDRLRRAQGQPEGHQGLARHREARRRDRHAQPEDVGQRQALVPRRLGLREAAGRLGRRRARVREEALRADAGARPRRARLDGHVRRRRSIGDVHLSWENEAKLEVEEAKGEVEIVVPVDQHPGASRTSRGSTRTSSTRAPPTVAKAYLEFLYTPEGAGDHREELLPPDAIPPCSRSTPREFPRHQAASTSPPSPRAGTTPPPSTSATAACSTASTSPSERGTRENGHDAPT